MAIGAITDISVALTDYFAPRAVRQINREAIMLAVLPVRMADPGQGQAVTWGIKTSGATAAAAADGAVAATPQFDARKKATLAYGDYQSPFSESGQSLAAAYHSMSPENFIDLISNDAEDSINALASAINKDWWVQNAGGGGVIPITSGASAHSNTGTYAGVNKASVTLWQGNFFANASVPRPLTLDLMRQARRAVRTNGGAVDLWVCDLQTFDRYGALIDPQRRYLDEIRTSKGIVKLDAGFKALEFEGAAIIGDKDAPAGTMVGLTSRVCEWRVLPKDQALAGIMHKVATGLYEENQVRFEAGLPVAILPLARVGDAENFLAVTYPQYVVRRPNQTCWIQDIA